MGKPWVIAGALTGASGQTAQELVFLNDGIPSAVADPSVGMQTADTRSRHPGGVNLLFADCSVHFINDEIEHGNLGGYWELEYGNDPANFMANFLTWERLIASTDGLEIDGDKLELQ